MAESVDRSSDFARFRRLGNQADRWALASESDAAKDLYAAAASRGRRTFQELQRDAEEGNLAGWDLVWVARLARVLALQPAASDLHDFAFDTLKVATAQLPTVANTLKFRKLFFELLFQRSELTEAKKFLEANIDLREIYHGYLDADLHNPFRGDSTADFDTWIDRFNKPFVAAGLSPVRIDSSASSPFDGLTTDAAATQHDGPLVTVIVTTFNPDPVELRTSVNSILAQTWKNIEVLLIDDCSTPPASIVLDEISSSDDRIRLIRLPVNGGTYRARNIGIENAAGKYVTGQDTDDWSHPERISREVDYLESHPDVPGITIAADRTDNDLIRVAVGQYPNRRCEVSLMTSVETAKAVGGYLSVRKAADSEFRERIDAWSEHSVHHLPDPLYITRMTPGSLSRGDFRPGWTHPTRLAFRSFFMHWHTHGTKDSLSLDSRSGLDTLATLIPQHIAGGGHDEKRHFDLCIISDWTSSAPEHRAAADELRALSQTDLSIAIVQLDSPWGQKEDWRALVPAVQQLVNSGKVYRTFLDEHVSTSLVLVRDPTVLDYARSATAAISADRVLVVAHSHPAEQRRHLQPYNVAHSHEMTKRLFNQEPCWTIPEDTEFSAFRSRWNVPVHSEKYPIYIDADRYTGIRLRRQGYPPVIGRVADNDAEEWPPYDQLLKVYPTNGSIDFRVLGDVRGALRASKNRSVLDSWIQYNAGDIDPSVYWRTLDAVLLFDQRAIPGAVERSILEALSSGLPIITDSIRSRTYGKAVVGSEPDTAVDEVRRIVADPAEIALLRNVGSVFLYRFSDPSKIRQYLQQRVNEARLGVE